MALCIRFICSNCGHAIESWDEGNPYYINRKGEKRYAYHPDHENLHRCIGNDSPHLCLKCGEEFMVDSRSPIEKCPKCDSMDIADTWKLDGMKCPKCKVGVFAKDAEFYAIS